MVTKREALLQLYEQKFRGLGCEVEFLDAVFEVLQKKNPSFMNAPNRRALKQIQRVASKYTEVKKESEKEEIVKKEEVEESPFEESRVEVMDSEPNEVEQPVEDTSVKEDEEDDGKDGKCSMNNA